MRSTASRYFPAFFLAISVTLLSLASPALGFSDDDTPAAKKPAAEATAPPPPADVTTEGSVVVGGQHILYNAIAGIITVGATDEQDAQLGADGKPLPDTDAALVKEPKDAPPTARMFYVAYIKKGDKSEDRPITFFYNGGPGSSTVWLHMGSLGPKHVSRPGGSARCPRSLQPDR